MNKPFFSIIIPLYNKESVIKDTLNSIITQSFTDYEIIIINDGSTDNSEQIVRQVKDERIKIITKENGGPSSARNFGMAEANGNYVYFLDADDRMTAESLKMMHQVITENPDLTLFCFNYYITRQGKRLLALSRKHSGIIHFVYLNWILRNYFPCPGTVVYQNGTTCVSFNEQYRRWEDTDFFFNLMRSAKLYYYNFPVFEYNQDSLAASLARNDWRQDFICNLAPEDKSFWERMCLYKLYLECRSLYPEIAREKYGKVFNKLYYRIIYSLTMRYLSFKWRNQ